MSSQALFHPPLPRNEPIHDYAPGSPERARLQARLREMGGEVVDLPMVIDGHEVRTLEAAPVLAPHDTQHVLGHAHQGGALQVEAAIRAATRAHGDWAATPWEERAAVFLRAADLLSGPWRDTINAATMLGQSKTVYQAEIDAAAELCDFFRFNVAYLPKILEDQPISAAGTWNRMEYRPLEGFVLAITPFNFTSIAGNLPSAPALLGNTVVWKPSQLASLSAHYLMQLLRAAGLPDGVINLVQGPPAELVQAAIADPGLAGIHFTGSTTVFQGIWSQVGENLPRYRNYPRLVGETGGKDFIVAHASAEVQALATAILRGGFEYQGQKCSAPSRLYSAVGVARAQRAPARRPAVHQDGRCRRFLQLHGGRHRPAGVQSPPGRGRRSTEQRRIPGGGGGRHRRRPRLVRGADGHPERRPDLAADA